MALAQVLRRQNQKILSNVNGFTGPIFFKSEVTDYPVVYGRIVSTTITTSYSSRKDEDDQDILVQDPIITVNMDELDKNNIPIPDFTDGWIFELSVDPMNLDNKKSYSFSRPPEINHTIGFVKIFLTEVEDIA